MSGTPEGQQAQNSLRPVVAALASTQARRSARRPIGLAASRGADCSSCSCEQQSGHNGVCTRTAALGVAGRRGPTPTRRSLSSAGGTRRPRVPRRQWTVPSALTPGDSPRTHAITHLGRQARLKRILPRRSRMHTPCGRLAASTSASAASSIARAGGASSLRRAEHWGVASPAGFVAAVCRPLCAEAPKNMSRAMSRTGNS
jgi:hypothetical protein